MSVLRPRGAGARVRVAADADAPGARRAAGELRRGPLTEERIGLLNWAAALLVAAGLAALVVLDLVDPPVERWFTAHALTTSAITGVLVLLVTVLIVDRIVDRRQTRDRADAIAAQAGLVNRQAQRAADAVSGAIHGDAERDAASDAIQTFTSMLMVSAPLLIDNATTRRFLEECDRLVALLARAMSQTDGGGPPPDDLDARVTAAGRSVRDAAQPLVATLDLAERTAVSGDDDSGGQPSSSA